MTSRILGIFVVVLLAGCGAKKVEAPKVGSLTKTYSLTGEVRKIDEKGGQLTLRHEAIPGYMDAMTMPFRVGAKDREGLADLQVGDKVSATLKVSDSGLLIEDVTVTEPAPPAELRLNLSGTSPILREKKRNLEPGEIVPDFAITLEDGSTAKLSEFKGKVVVLTFIYIRCPDPNFCPLMDTKFAELAKSISAVASRAEKVRLLSISFDPEHDTPEALSKHAKLRGAKRPLWRFAVAAHAELAKVAEPLGLTYGPRENEIIHSLSTAVIGPDGRLVGLFPGSDWKVDEVTKSIRSVIAQ